MPTYLNPFKKDFYQNPQHRLENMKNLYDDIDKCEVSSWEVDQNRAVPTIETVRHLRDIYDIDKLYLIIGADNLAHISSWQGYKELKELTIFVVATRDGIDTQGYQTLSVSCDISSSEIRANYEEL